MFIEARRKKSGEVYYVFSKVEVDNHARLKYTSDKADYIFFDSLDWNKARRTLKEAYDRLKLRHKTYHCCRHSFTTNLVGKLVTSFW